MCQRQCFLGLESNGICPCLRASRSWWTNAASGWGSRGITSKYAVTLTFHKFNKRIQINCFYCLNFPHSISFQNWHVSLPKIYEQKSDDDLLVRTKPTVKLAHRSVCFSCTLLHGSTDEQFKNEFSLCVTPIHHSFWCVGGHTHPAVSFLSTRRITSNEPGSRMSVLSAVSCSRGGNLEHFFLWEVFSDCTWNTARQTITLQTEKCNMLEPPKF